jgi:hypothetical protein
MLVAQLFFLPKFKGVSDSQLLNKQTYGLNFGTVLTDISYPLRRKHSTPHGRNVGFSKEMQKNKENISRHSGL